jgi:hypothetical protein
VAGEYTIAGGLADAQRLARQARVMAEATEAFLSGLELASGWACLDVGCGDGALTILDVVLIDEHGVAESWSARQRYTNGVLPLGTPPEKDDGFPYAHSWGNASAAVTAAMAPYSGQST